MNKDKSENIYSFKGFKTVFLFTLKQTFKNKGYIISFIVTVLVMTIMGPVMYLANKSDNSFAENRFSLKESGIKKVYISNETDIPYEDVDFMDIIKEVSPNEIDELPDIKVVVGDVFIQLNKNQRIKRIHRHTANCTICCVNDTDCITNVELLKPWRI